MSNASLKEQLLAVASQISETKVKPSINKMVEKKPIKSKSPQGIKHKGAAKPKWLEFAQYGVELLRTYYPNCFKAANEIKPLKIGIKQDLIKHLSTLDTVVTEDKACMVKSLSYYVNTMAYHKSVIDGAIRVDLEGNPAGAVSEAEAKYSSDRQHARLQAKQAKAIPMSQPKEVKN